MTAAFKQPISGEATASVQRRYEIMHKDLPLSCPGKWMRLWDSHPRVYLPIEATGKETCPYCGAEYVLLDWEKPAAE